MSGRDCLDQPETYRIEIEGRLDEDWSDWFDGLIIASEDEESIPITTLSGTVVDQAALHGILIRIRDLGLPLLSVRRVEIDR